MTPDDPPPDEPISPTALQDSSAPLVRKIRAAHTAGVDLTLDATAAGEIADYIETLARMADDAHQKLRSLQDRIDRMEAEVEYFQHGYEWAKALIIQSQKPG